MEKVNWNKGTTEATVNKFYSHGVENFGEFHGGYLNFGLWEEGQTDYIVAAENLIHTLGEKLELDGEEKILDCACGMGPQDVYLGENFKFKSITGLDLVHEHLKFATKRVKNAGLENKINFINGTATELPFDDKSFNRVLCVEGLVHFNTRATFFKEAHRVLDDNGILVTSDYCLKRDPKNIFEKFVLQATLSIWNIPKENADSVPGYKKRLEDIGFKTVTIDQVGADVIPGYFYEQHSKECLEELTRIRGFLAGRVGHIVDYAVYWSYKLGLIDYILVKAKK